MSKLVNATKSMTQAQVQAASGDRGAFRSNVRHMHAIINTAAASSMRPTMLGFANTLFM